MRILSLAAVALALVAPSGAAAKPAGSTAALDCSQFIGADGPPIDGYAKVLGVAWLPTHRALGSVRLVDPPTPTARWWSKQGLVIKAGSTFTLAVPDAWQGRLAIGWGSPAQPSEEVTVSGCDSGGRWLAYAGGYWVSEPACVPLVVESGRRHKTVHIGVGAPCRGQTPPPTYVPAAAG